MTKFFAILPALALVVALSSSALADNGVSTMALEEMGLAGIEVMSDDAAMAIRGKGWQGGHQPPKPNKGAEKPWSLAFGASYANVDGHGAGAGTIDGFAAEGKYMAAGEHFSEAGKTFTESKLLEVKGQPATLEVTTKSIRVFAGGFATASSL
ncbi:MAG: hypothetical protein KDA57_18950 [Planctomycetales bacterium]|nr:hypothetical protein [Planctomycetales bacterium]